MPDAACSELVDRPLISINRGNEIVAHGRPLAVTRLIAVGARHAGSAAALTMGAIPRLVRMGLAHPARALAARAFASPLIHHFILATMAESRVRNSPYAALLK